MIINLFQSARPADTECADFEMARLRRFNSLRFTSQYRFVPECRRLVQLAIVASFHGVERAGSRRQVAEARRLVAASVYGGDVGCA